MITLAAGDGRSGGRRQTFSPLPARQESSAAAGSLSRQQLISRAGTDPRSTMVSGVAGSLEVKSGHTC